MEELFEECLVHELISVIEVFAQHLLSIQQIERLLLLFLHVPDIVLLESNTLQDYLDFGCVEPLEFFLEVLEQVILLNYLLPQSLKVQLQLLILLPLSFLTLLNLLLLALCFGRLNWSLRFTFHVFLIYYFCIYLILLNFALVLALVYFFVLVERVYC